MISTILITLGVVCAIVLFPLTLLVLSGALATVPVMLFTALWSAAIMWLVGQTFLGQWLVEGAAFLGLILPQDQLWKVAAFLAFVGGFFKPATHTHEKKTQISNETLQRLGLGKYAK